MTKLLSSKDFREFNAQVLGWNETFGNKVSNGSLIDTYKNLTLEELNETITAFKSNDHEEVIDGLCDVIYTGFFWSNLNGVTIGDVLGLDDSPLESISVTLTNMKRSLLEGDVLCFMSYLKDTLVELSSKYNFVEAFKRVTESNFSKAIPVEGSDIDKIIEDVYGEGRYSSIFKEQRGSFYILKARDDMKEGVKYPLGKIIKVNGLYKSVEELGGLKEFIYKEVP